MEKKKKRAEEKQMPADSVVSIRQEKTCILAGAQSARIKKKDFDFFLF